MTFSGEDPCPSRTPLIKTLIYWETSIVQTLENQANLDQRVEKTSVECFCIIPSDIISLSGTVCQRGSDEHSLPLGA